MSVEMRDVGQEDLVPVYSRVSWGAIFAGMFVALAVTLVLGALGTAIGLSVADQVNGNTVATGAGIWAVATALVAFFCGGCVASRCTAGESRTEATIYGTILWGLTFATLLWMGGGVVRTGIVGVVGSANAAASAPANWDAAAQRAGLTNDQMTRLRAELPTAEQMRAQTAPAAWWSLAGVVVTLLASVLGAVAGAGASPALGGFLFRRAAVRVTRYDSGAGPRPAAV